MAVQGIVAPNVGDKVWIVDNNWRQAATSPPLTRRRRAVPIPVYRATVVKSGLHQLTLEYHTSKDAEREGIGPMRVKRSVVPVPGDRPCPEAGWYRTRKQALSALDDGLAYQTRVHHQRFARTLDMALRVSKKLGF